MGTLTGAPNPLLGPNYTAYGIVMSLCPVGSDFILACGVHINQGKVYLAVGDQIGTLVFIAAAIDKTSAAVTHCLCLPSEDFANYFLPSAASDSKPPAAECWAICPVGEFYNQSGDQTTLIPDEGTLQHVLKTLVKYMKRSMKLTEFNALFFKPATPAASTTAAAPTMVAAANANDAASPSTSSTAVLPVVTTTVTVPAVASVPSSVTTTVSSKPLDPVLVHPSATSKTISDIADCKSSSANNISKGSETATVVGKRNRKNFQPYNATASDDDGSDDDPIESQLDPKGFKINVANVHNKMPPSKSELKKSKADAAKAAKTAKAAVKTPAKTPAKPPRQPKAPATKTPAATPGANKEKTPRVNNRKGQSEQKAVDPTPHPPPLPGHQLQGWNNAQPPPWWYQQPPPGWVTGNVQQPPPLPPADSKSLKKREADQAREDKKADMELEHFNESKRIENTKALADVL